MKENTLRNIGTVALGFINSTNQSIFLTGGAGTGKTTFLKFLKENCNRKLAVAAPTGVAAVNAGGVTIHSLFGLQARPLDEQYLKSVRPVSAARDLLRELELLVIDEASMLRADLFDAMDFLLREIRSVDLPLGGLQIILIGDLFQLPPVELTGENESSVDGYTSQYFANSRVYPQLNIVSLEFNKTYRQSDRDFIDLLNTVRNGKLSDQVLTNINTRFDPDWQNRENAIIITTHNQRADDLNAQKLQHLPGISQVVVAEITGDFPIEHRPVETMLNLKIGAQVMVVKNDPSPQKAFFNGKIGIVTHFDENLVSVKFNDATSVTLGKETWTNIQYAVSDANQGLKQEAIGTFSQFPIKLGWAITVHKSQGLTFDRAILDVSQAFAPGQVYVALSRVSTFQGVILKSKIPHNAIKQAVFEAGAFYVPDITVAEKVLQEKKTDFLVNKISIAFDFTSLLSGLNTLPPELQTPLIPAVEKLNRFGRKFTEEIKNRMSSNPEWQTIRDRVDQAVDYFKREIEQSFIAPLKQFIVSHKNDFIYRSVVNTSKNQLKPLKEKIIDIGFLKNILASIINPLIYSPVISLSKENPDPSLPILTGQFFDAPAPVSTETQSLTLFLQGNSIGEIARLRGLGVPAVEYHLATFIPTGEVKLQDLIATELLDKALPMAEKMVDRSVAKLRPVLGDLLSIGQLQAIVSYFKPKF